MVKGEVKAELDAIVLAKGQDERLAHILKALRTLQDEPTATDPIRHVVWSMSALVHHERFGGLTPPQTRRIAKYALTVLHASGIVPGSSRAAVLYGEIYRVQSLIARRQGRVWDSAWLQRLSHQAVPRKTPTISSQGLLGSAIRALRAADARAAESMFADVEVLGDNAADVIRARLGRVICKRLRGELEAAAALSADALAKLDLTARTRRELQWEDFCRAAIATGDLNPMLAAVRPGGTHREGYYVLEAFFWTRAQRREEWRDRLPSLSWQRRDAHLKPQQFGLIFKIAEAIERCSDPTYPLPFRIARLGEVLGKAKQLLTLEREILAWAAAYRALARAHVPDFAAMALREYHGICLRLSDGDRDDCLGLGIAAPSAPIGAAVKVT